MLVLDLKLRLDFDFVLGFDIFVNLRRFFRGFDLLGLVFDLKLRLVFDFVLTLIFGM